MHLCLWRFFHSLDYSIGSFVLSNEVQETPHCRGQLVVFCGMDGDVRVDTGHLSVLSLRSSSGLTRVSLGSAHEHVLLYDSSGRRAASPSMSLERSNHLFRGSMSEEVGFRPGEEGTD